MLHCDLSIISRGSEIFMSRCLGNFGVTATEAVILVYLYENDKPRQEDLSDYFMLDKGTIAKTLRKLENKEMIERLVNPEDQRAKIISVTEKGLCVRAVCTSLVRIWYEQLFMGFSQEDASVFECNVKKIAGNVIDILKEWETLYDK